MAALLELGLLGGMSLEVCIFTNHDLFIAKCQWNGGMCVSMDELLLSKVRVGEEFIVFKYI